MCHSGFITGKALSLGPSLISGQESNLGVWLTALLRGEYAFEPLFGRLLFGMVLPLVHERIHSLLLAPSDLTRCVSSAPPTVARYSPPENGNRGEVGMIKHCP